MSIFADYPKMSRENPFEMDSAGTYFAYLTNRECCFSYLSDRLEDFQYNNNALYEAMPMGYTALWVLERCWLADSDGTCRVFGNEIGTQTLYCLENLDTKQWQKVSQARLMEIARFPVLKEYLENEMNQASFLLQCVKKQLPCSKIVAVGVKLIEEYNWH